jgi:DNA-binding GntR family transcriptional regulator
MKQKVEDAKESFFSNNDVQVGRSAKSLPEMVAEQLLAAIQEGALEPGEHLKEEIFSERFAVSRSTIREAIALLERRGVVQRIPRQGARVVVVDAAEIEEIFNIRAQLLGLAARLAAASGTDELVQGFEQKIAHIERLAADPATAPAEYGSASIDAQQLLISTSSGKRLRAMYEELSNAALWRFAVRERAISFQTAKRRRESAQDWRRVADAITNRDEENAERYAKAVLLASYQAIKDQI